MKCLILRLLKSRPTFVLVAMACIPLVAVFCRQQRPDSLFWRPFARVGTTWSVAWLLDTSSSVVSPICAVQYPNVPTVTIESVEKEYMFAIAPGVYLVGSDQESKSFVLVGAQSWPSSLLSLYRLRHDGRGWRLEPWTSITLPQATYAERIAFCDGVL